MPGIAGIIERGGRPDASKVLRSMIERMKHEKFYVSGTFENDRLGLRLGWICQDGSYADGLPVWNETKDVCLVFCGEDAKDESELAGLRARGHRFESRYATYLVHMYEDEGIGFLDKLNGFFSGILIDLRDDRVILFNDRFGLHRIYIHEGPDRFLFASEAKSLLSAEPRLRNLDQMGFGEFFALGCTLENRTVFSGVSLLPGGSAWVFTPGRSLEKRTYFDKRTWEDQIELDAAAYYQELRRTFPRILRRYQRQNEKVGVSLTGGIDTRMIMAWAEFPPLKVPCYTFGGMVRDCADVRIARRVAHVCQQPHTTIGVNRKFFSEFPALAKKSVYYTDGTMTVGGAVELFVNRIAREIAPIRLTGNYGDQVVRRAIGFGPLCLCPDVFSADFRPLVQAGVERLNTMRSGSELSFFAFRQLPWYHYPRLALESTQVVMRSPFIDNDLLRLAYQAPPECAKSLSLSLKLIAEGNPVLGRIPTDRGLRHRPLPGITAARHLLHEFSFKAEYAYDYGMPQWLARLDRRLRRFHLERVFLGRHKFYHFRVWYREALSRYIQDILLDPRTLKRPYLNGPAVESLVKAHVGGLDNYTNEIHMLLTSELALRHLLERV
jgi:asparagine synthase (glutamine-hydrolysing)